MKIIKNTTAFSRDSRQRFVKLINVRMNKALKYLNLIGNLSNVSNYDYTEDEAKVIVTRLRKSVDEIEVRFKMQNEVDPSNHFDIEIKE
jgi:hypothetical protein